MSSLFLQNVGDMFIAAVDNIDLSEGPVDMIRCCCATNVTRFGVRLWGEIFTLRGRRATYSTHHSPAKAGIRNGVFPKDWTIRSASNPSTVSDRSSSRFRPSARSKTTTARSTTRRSLHQRRNFKRAPGAYCENAARANQKSTLQNLHPKLVRDIRSLPP